MRDALYTACQHVCNSSLIIPALTDSIHSPVILLKYYTRGAVDVIQVGHVYSIIMIANYSIVVSRWSVDCGSDKYLPHRHLLVIAFVIVVLALTLLLAILALLLVAT